MEHTLPPLESAESAQQSSLKSRIPSLEVKNAFFLLFRQNKYSLESMFYQRENAVVDFLHCYC